MHKKNVYVPGIERWLVILGYLEMFDSDGYSVEEKRAMLSEAAEFVTENIDPQLTMDGACRRIFEWYFVYKKWNNSRFVENSENKNHFIRKFVARNDVGTISRKTLEGSMVGPDFSDDGEKIALESEPMKGGSIENVMRRISLRHIVIQTLLVFWIMFILLIKIDSISLFLSNPANQALMGMSTAIGSLIPYMIASK